MSTPAAIVLAAGSRDADEVKTSESAARDRRPPHGAARPGRGAGRGRPSGSSSSSATAPTTSRPRWATWTWSSPSKRSSWVRATPLCRPSRCWPATRAPSSSRAATCRLLRPETIAQLLDTHMAQRRRGHRSERGRRRSDGLRPHRAGPTGRGPAAVASSSTPTRPPRSGPSERSTAARTASTATAVRRAAGDRARQRARRVLPARRGARAGPGRGPRCRP